MRYLIHVKVQHLGRAFKRSLASVYSEDTQTGPLGRRLSNHNVLWKQKIPNCFFAYGPNNIHKYEGCFLRGQVSLNGFKVFNGFIVEYLNVIGLFAKKLDNLLFSENVVIGQSSFFQVSRFECSHCVTKLCSEQFSVCQTLFTVYRKQVKKAHSVD